MTFLDQFNILNILRNKIWGQFKTLEKYGKGMRWGSTRSYLSKTYHAQTKKKKKSNLKINEILHTFGINLTY
jgi:hypothetical protein